jgi:4-alpha-glucanotransferase
MPHRSSGVLLHPTSLPGPGASGSLGEAAHDFVRFLSSARQGVWQILPLGPPSASDSPYMATSAFAINPLLLDADDLVRRGWLDAAALRERPARSLRSEFRRTEQWLAGRVIPAAAAGFEARATEEERRAFARFVEEAHWLEDYVLFEALSEQRRGEIWNQWPSPLRDREPGALGSVREALSPRLSELRFVQFALDRQWAAVRTHANEKGIEVVGDIPIFVGLHSADVWANRWLFELDADGVPANIAGVPPDYFSPTGQRWGNPLYRWEASDASGHAWWNQRFRWCFRHADRVRIDHFRGFEAYWSIPAEAEDATAGAWRPGPGAAFFARVREAIGDLPIIAEDLGVITPEVEALRDGLGLPGMRILQFAFVGEADHPYLPHNYVPRTVVYTGTHDNDTTVGWYRSLSAVEADQVRRYLWSSGDNIAWDLIRAAWMSVAGLAVVPAQDLLSLDGSHRMNVPGVGEGNWSWRLADGALHDGIAAGLRELGSVYGRS